MVYFHRERVFSKILSHFVRLQASNVWLGLGMYHTTNDCFQTLPVLIISHLMSLKYK